MTRAFWVRLYLTTIAFHGTSLFFTFKRTYDAYVHIFFADHYRRMWFDHWETRWYTGFPIHSYPPGTHQLTALLSKILGLQNAFICIQMTAILILVTGVYRFSRLWVSPRAAEFASLAAVLSSSLCLTVHVFGQLPTTFSLGILLNALVYGDSWLREGRWTHLWVALGLGAATTACHHVTTLFGGVFFVGPVVLRVLSLVIKQEPQHRKQALKSLAWRTLIYGIGLISLLILVVLPYWIWSVTDPIAQVSIPHASRDSFLENLDAGLVFWLIPHGLTLLVIPQVIRRTFTDVWPLCFSYWALFILGTGGTTPIPRMLLRGAFDILTLDRFTIWASVIVLPIVGESLLGQAGKIRRPLQGALALSALVLCVYTVNLTQFRSFQPRHVQVGPIVDFMAQDGHSNWRYLALGFGDQMAWLSANTTATTVDGNYHSARRLTELTSFPVERLEGAKYRGEQGLRSLHQFLFAPQKFNLKFVFCNDEFYDPLLFFCGFQRISRLDNGVVLWEKSDVPMLVQESQRKELQLELRLMWGILPLTAMACGGLLLFSLGELRLPQHPEQTVCSNLALPLAVALLLSAGFVGLNREAESTPEETLRRYLEHLDFRREDDAWSLLTVESRPTLAGYKTQRSVQNGLFASYAKLERVDLETTKQEDDRLSLKAKLKFLTPFGIKEQVEDFVLRRQDELWRVEYKNLEQRAKRSRIWTKAGVTWRTRGRKTAGDRLTDFDEIMDRPYYVLHSARAVRRGPNVVVMGELSNQDSDPAVITISASLIREGEVVQTRNHRIGKHLLEPGEWTPFRIDFEDPVPEFDRVELSCQTVVADSITPPPIKITEVSPAQLRLQNLGSREATVPMLLEVERDADGELLDVKSQLVPQAIRPGRSHLFTRDSQSADSIQESILPLKIFAQTDELSTPDKHWKVVSFARSSDQD